MTRGEKTRIENMKMMVLKLADDTTNEVDRLELLAWAECLDWILYACRCNKPTKKRRRA